MKRAMCSAALAVPCAFIATGISDSTAVSDFFRYALSPGTMLAVQVIHPQASHRGVGVFLDALNAYTRTMSFVLLLNAIFYSLFIFGVWTTISALLNKDLNR